MMVKRSRLSAMVFLAILPMLLTSIGSRLEAQWTIGLGAAVPIGSSADLLNAGYNGVFAYSLRPTGMRNHIRFEAAVNALTEKTPAKAKRQIASGTVNYVIVARDETAPTGYVIVGLGTYQKSGGGTVRHADPGINVGAGIKFSMGFFGTFVEARLHYIHDDDKTKYFPMTFGLWF